MTPLAALVFVGLFVVCVLLAFGASWILSRRTADLVPDPLIRAGAPEAADPHTAARRASGSAAWMRPDGGGL